MLKFGKIFTLWCFLFISLAVVAMAGNLEPSGQPAGTMKTLDEIPPTWSQLLSTNNGDSPSNCNSSRFGCLFFGCTAFPCAWTNHAVLDKETGLVWELVPDTTNRTWPDAVKYCLQKKVALKMGWRLPSASEFSSLVDAATQRIAAPNPFPAGVDNNGYWTTTESPSSPGYRAKGLANGTTGTYLFDFPEEGTFGHRAWCVRGGNGE